MSVEILKAIPCPAGDKCNAFHCLFNHPKDAIAASEKDGSSGSSSMEKGQPPPAPPSAPTDALSRLQQPARAPRDDEEEGGPRKRVKLSGGEDLGPGPGTPAERPGPTQAIAKASSQRMSPGQPPKRTSSGLVKLPPPSSSPFASGARPRTPETSRHEPTASSAKPQPVESLLYPRHVPGLAIQASVRRKLLKMLHQEFVRLNSELRLTAKSSERKLIIHDQGLVVEALDEEQRIGAEKGPVYTNAIKHRIMHYRRMKTAQWIEERAAAQKKQQEKSSGGQPTVPKAIETGLTPRQEVDLLRRHLLTPVAGHARHGYVPVAPRDEEVEAARKGLEAAQGWEKCDRCESRFQVFPGRREDGALSGGGPCTYHRGRAVAPERTVGNTWARPARQWDCCGTMVGQSPGCTEAPHHVFKVTDPKTLSAVLPFAETPVNDEAPDGRAVCFDCEMAYTTRGLELVRLTATSWPTGETLLDVLVMPYGEVLDLNSRFSGVWPEDMADAEIWTEDVPPPPPPAPMSRSEPSDGDGENSGHKKPPMKMVPSPAAARSLLFSLLSPTTPLIGHGLENDLNATRVIHPAVVDTVLLFPHPRGLPMRNGLKALMARHLNQTIQAATGKGHDSAEDARAAGDLVRLKVGEHWPMLESNGWELDENGLVEPANGVRRGE